MFAFVSSEPKCASMLLRLVLYIMPPVHTNVDMSIEGV